VLIPAIAPAIRAYGASGGLNQGFVDRLSVYTTGYHPTLGTFNVQSAVPTWLGIGAGIMVHKMFGKYVNRYIPKPFGL